MIQNPWLRLVGASYLVYLALNHFADGGKADSAIQQTIVGGGTSLWSVVLSLKLADRAFSLDNVVAAVALLERYWIVMLGVAFGIVTMRFAAGIFTRLINWEPALQHSAFLLILAITVELLLDDLFQIHLHELAQFAISATIMLLTVGFARIGWPQPLNVMRSPLLRLSIVLQHLLHGLMWSLRAVLRRITNRKRAVSPGLSSEQ